jgi:cell division protein FtsA
MVSKKNIIASLDIGTAYTKVAIAEVFPDGQFNVIGVGSAPSKGLRKGVVINIESTIEAIKVAVEMAETMAGIRLENVVTAVSGVHIESFTSHGIVAIKNHEVNAHDVERVIEAAKAVAMPADREVLHVLPQEFIVDDQDGIKEPIGISGVRLEAKVHIITGSISSAQNIVKCANRSGLTVSDMSVAALSSARAVLSPEEQELGACVVDIGGGVCDVIVVQGSAVKHVGVIPIGGAHITNDIATGLHTPLAAAESIKCTYGSALGTLIDRDETLEVPSTGGRSSRIVSRLFLTEIIEPRVQEILTLVYRDILKNASVDMLSSGLVITGGTANMAGIVEAAEQILNMPVRISKNTISGGLSDLVSNPEYSTCVGLLGTAGKAYAEGKLKLGSGFSLGSIVRKISGIFGSKAA